MNTVLFLSSSIFTYLHIYYNYGSLFFRCIFLRGCLTSLLNHGTNIYYFKYYDRIVMVETAIIKLIICFINKFYINLMLTYFAIIFYLVAKKYTNHWFHLIAHVFITISNITFLKNI